jgi:hypothetical protein
MRPEKPRKSRFGRFTHCTGIRNDCSARSSSTGTVSRKPSSVGPWYHGVFALGTTMLSPFSADSGMNVTSSRPMRRAKSRYSSSIAENTSCE